MSLLTYFKIFFPSQIEKLNFEIYKFVLIRNTEIYLVLDNDYFKIFINWNEILNIIYLNTSKENLFFVLTFLDFYIPANKRLLYAYQNYNLEDFEYLLRGNFNISQEVLSTLINISSPSIPFLKILYKSPHMIESLDLVLFKDIIKIQETDYAEELIDIIIDFKIKNPAYLYKFILQLININNIYLFYIFVYCTWPKLIQYDRYGMILIYLITKHLNIDIDTTFYKIDNVVFEIVKNCVNSNNLFYFKKIVEKNFLTPNMTQFVINSGKNEFMKIIDK